MTTTTPTAPPHPDWAPLIAERDRLRELLKDERIRLKDEAGRYPQLVKQRDEAIKLRERSYAECARIAQAQLSRHIGDGRMPSDVILEDGDWEKHRKAEEVARGAAMASELLIQRLRFNVEEVLPDAIAAVEAKLDRLAGVVTPPPPPRVEGPPSRSVRDYLPRTITDGAS